MQGTILIIDSVATNRILLKAKLAPAFYDIAQAERGAGLVPEIRATQPDLIIMAARLEDSTAPELCQRIKAHSDLAATPILVLTSQNDPQLRCEALSAGADDVMSYPLNDIILQARIRSMVRTRNSAEELRLRDGTSRALGFAEPAAGFAPATSTMILVEEKTCGARWQAGLKPLIPGQLSYHTLNSAFSVIDADSAPDVLIMSWSRARADVGMRLLADLRARASTRHAGIIVVLDAADQDLAAAALDLGANDVMTCGFEAQELALRLKAQIRSKQTQDRLRATVRNGLKAAIIDPMTGLYNRRYAMPHLARIAARNSEKGRSFAVMLADLDHFKRINDAHGHAAGDAVLVETARRLKSNIRAIDLVARVGGEEFLIVMPETSQAHARAVAQRICQTIDGAPFAISKTCAPIHVTMSIGLTIVSPADTSVAFSDSTCATELLGLADRALYKSKDGGRNQVTILRPAA